MVQIPVDQVIEAARALRLAGRWPLAGQLLAEASTDSPAERAALALAGAEVAVDGDFWLGTDTAAMAIGQAAEAVAQTGQEASFDLEFFRLRRDYFSELIGPEGPKFGPDGRDPAAVDDLMRRAGRLRQNAPDQSLGGQASFYAGVIADNLRGDPAAARPLFTAALAAGEQSGDDLLTAEALRHLGYLNDQAGDRELAMSQWRRATRLRQRAGCVPLTLAQQLLIAEVTVREDPGGTLPLVAGVRDWAAGLGIGLLVAQADALLSAEGARS